MDPKEQAKQIQKTGLDIGFLCAGWPPDVGGVESHAQDLARALRKRGHRIHVFCLEVNAELEPFSISTTVVDGVDVRRLAYAYGDHDRLGRVAVNSRAEDAIHGWLAETPCDLVHVHHLTGFGMGALRAISDIGAPCVMTLHDYWSLCPRGQMLSASNEICARPEREACSACLSSTWPHLMPSGTGVPSGPRDEPLADDGDAVDARTEFALDMLELPDRLLTPSEASRAVFLRAGVSSDRIAVCENGVEVSELAQQVERERAEVERSASDAVRLGVLGTVLPSKGVLELARTFVEAGIEGLRLEVHGNLPSYHGDESYVGELRALSEAHPELGVHGPYAREDLPRILANLDGVAAPSRWEEVFGLSVREARAAGLPVLVSDAGALPDVVGDATAPDQSEGSRVVPRDDWAAWSDALREFAANGRLSTAQSSGAPLPRSTEEMMLQIERAYVEVIIDSTGSTPVLKVPIDGLGAPVEEPKKGWLGRLFKSGKGS